MLCATGSDVFDANLFIQRVFECLLRGRCCSKCWVHSSEQTGKAPSVSHDSHAEVVFAFMHESPTPAYLPVVRGQQAGFPIVLAAAWSSGLSLSSPWLQGEGEEC